MMMRVEPCDRPRRSRRGTRGMISVHCNTETVIIETLDWKRRQDQDWISHCYLACSCNVHFNKWKLGFLKIFALHVDFMVLLGSQSDLLFDVKLTHKRYSTPCIIICNQLQKYVLYIDLVIKNKTCTHPPVSNWRRFLFLFIYLFTLLNLQC